jgi:hypothetical protein
MIMFLVSPAFAANNSKLGEPAALDLLEYMGLLVESKDGLVGPDTFIEEGISDTSSRSKDGVRGQEIKNEVKKEDMNKEDANENL